MHPATMLAILCLVVWFILAFVVAIPSGWVHVPLGLGSVFMVRGLVGRRTD
jgi:uncharacterized membrane protein (DUF485 family)